MYIALFNSFRIDGEYFNAGRNSRWTTKDIPFKELATTTGHAVLPDISFKGYRGVMLCKFRDGSVGRKEENIEYHTGIVVDIDQGANMELLERLKSSEYELWCFSTAKSTAEALRLRIMSPLTEPVSCEEYPIAVKQFCEALDLEYDSCSLKGNQIMYLPECLKEHKDERINEYYSGKPFTYTHDEAALEAQRVINKYTSTDNKPRIIEAFCSCVTAEQILEEMYSHRYERVGNKFRLIDSTNPPGVYILDDGLAYSHHSTDDLFRGEDGLMHKLNAFDLFIRYYGLNFPRDRERIEKLIKSKYPEVWKEYLVLACTP